jgi:hypothetical protein
MGWCVVDHARDDKVVRGPFADATTAAAVRTELERSHAYYRDNGNLWITPTHDEPCSSPSSGLGSSAGVSE